MFRLIEPSSGQIQNIVLVHSVSAHSKGEVVLMYIILTCRRSKGIIPLILNLGIATGEWSTSGPRCFTLERTNGTPAEWAPEPGWMFRTT
jgi:hypothetical protein